MPFLKGDVAVTEVNEIKWRLLEPISYQGERELFTVPKGFVTDFASIPRIFFWLLPSYGTYTRAAILHDYLLSKHVVSTKDADGIFRRALRELRVPFVRRWLMWAAVRLHSGLEGATTRDLVQWITVSVPAAIFLAFPAVVVFVWLVLFWIIEVIFYFALRPLSSKQVNPPRFMG